MPVQGSPVSSTQGTKNALWIVQQVQRRLRLPLSSDFNDTHALFILGMANEVQRDYLTQVAVWDQLKLYGNVTVSPPAAGSPATVTIQVPGYEIDVLRRLYIEGYPEIDFLSDDEFLDRIRIASGNAERPTYCRIRSRSLDSVTVEVGPVPDQDYVLQTELLLKPFLMEVQDDMPMLDPDTIVLGAIMLASLEAGLDYQEKLAAFQANLSLTSSANSESNWGDVEPI